MKNSFYCDNCDKKFEAESIRKEYTDPVFGSCVSFHAFCPDCNKDCQEALKLKKFKGKSMKVRPLCGNSDNCCSCQS